MRALGFALDNAYADSTLRGIEGIYIVVEELRPEIERDGLTKKQLLMDTKLNLQNAGIKVLSEEEWLETKGGCHLDVNVNIGKQPKFYFYNINTEFIQRVYLVRQAIEMLQRAAELQNPQMGAAYEEWGITWASSIMGIEFSLDKIRSKVKDEVDRFINAYLSVNPK